MESSDEYDVSHENNVSYMPPGTIYWDVTPDLLQENYRCPHADAFGLLKDATLEFDGGRLTGWKSSSSSTTLRKMVEAAGDKAKALSSMTIGLNPMLKYGYGMNAFSRRPCVPLSGRFIDHDRGLLTGGKAALVRNGALVP